MKCKIGGQTVELEIEGRVRQDGRDLTVSRKGCEGITTHRHAVAPPFSFTLSGQIRGGKNNMKVGRNGKHYPDKTFAKWRDAAVGEVRKHLSRQPIPYFPKPLILEIEVHYAAGDLRRRDIPGMLDALFHVLERAQVVEDDAQIQEAHWYQFPVNREHPSVRVTVKERKACGYME